MRRHRQTADEILSALTAVETSWRDAHSDAVIDILQAIPDREVYGPAEVKALLATDFTAGLTAVKGDNTKRDAMFAAMQSARIDSPRGAFTMSRQHNPIQDFYIREVKGQENVVAGVAVKGLADPGRGCKM